MIPSQQQSGEYKNGFNASAFRVERYPVSSYLLALYLVALNAADWTLTYIAINFHNLAESNPLIAGWIASWPGFIAKTFLVGVIGWRFYSKTKVQRPAYHVLVAACVVYTLVVSWNTYAIFIR